MQILATTTNWKIETSPNVLEKIHQNHINITIYDRDVAALKDEINALVKEDFSLKTSGDIAAIQKTMNERLDPNTFSGIVEDVTNLLRHFKEVTKVNDFRLLLTTVNSNMCRRFHTDINNIRMLCTYSGPGTLWLTEDNINQQALSDPRSGVPIPLRENEVRQVHTGQVALLKGALYPNTKSAVVHRSPTIEETGEQRLLLRVDTNSQQNLWT